MTTLDKFLFLLKPKQKKQATLIIIFVTIGLFFEIFSLGIIFPIFKLALNTDKILEFEKRIGIDFKLNTSMFLIYSMYFLIVIYLIKTLFLYFLARQQSIFSSEIVESISSELFNGYMRLPYKFHLENNSSRLIRNISGETGAFLAYLQSVLIVISESSIALSIFILLLIVEFKGTLILIVFLLISAVLFNYFTKNKLNKWGQLRQIHDAEYARHMLQGLNGIKDIIIQEKENYFLSKFNHHNKQRTVISIKHNTIIQVPRLYLEFLTILSLALLIIILISNGRDINNFIPLLSVFVASAFRVMPSVNKIFVSLSTIKFHKGVVQELYKEISLVRDNEIIEKKSVINKLIFKNKIELKNINFKYETNKRQILNDLNLEIIKGQKIGIIGVSGTGKSTLIDIILGLLMPDSGEIIIDEEIKLDETTNLRQFVGYVPQSIYFTDDTLENNIAFGVEKNEINHKDLTNAIKKSQLEDFINKLPEGLQTNIGERGVKLSGGQRQRIGIARALYRNPQILVFDEATSSLDINTELAVMQTIDEIEGDITIILVAHRISTLKNCDIIYKVENGQIVTT
jgi:ABC-type multidrug transport system fused ATPase/permease subunit